jgi:hypothetical protein
MKVNKLITAIAAIIAGFAGLSAQNGTLTPYSRYGYGILSDHATSTQRALGGIGYAMNSGRQINVMNPASYAATDSLTFIFDMGVTASNLWSNETVDGTRSSDKNFSGGLDYITMQFPLCKFIGMSIGILPYSTVGYAFANSIDNGSSSRSGSGSLNELYAGLGIRPFKGFSVGANVSYLFGSIYNDTYAITDLGSTSLFEREITVRDYMVYLGAQYSLNIGKKNRFTLGLAYTPAKSFHGKTVTYYYDVNSDSDATETGYSRLSGQYSSPETWGAGINYQWNNKLMVEADYTYQPWSKAKYEGLSAADVAKQLADRNKISFGVQYQPDIRGGYGKRIQYRLGTFLNNDYLIVKDNKVRDYGASLGLGLPVPGYKTTVNIGFEWRHRQAHPDPLLKENYFNITLGVNFIERWFVKEKIY